MKILSIGNFTTGWDGSICDEEHVASALEFMGHGVIRCQRGEVNTNDGNNDYDFTLVAQWDGYGSLSWLPKPLVYWAFDYQRDGQEWHERLIEQADLYLSKRISDSKYPNWQWLSQDFAPTFLDKAPDVEKDIDVLFTGTYLDYSEERNAILKAVDDKYNLVIHSVNPEAWQAQGFKNVNGPVMDEQLPGLIARAKINLSVDAVLERGYWSDRNAQIMACGGFVMYGHVPLSEARFGNKINYFHNIEECLENIEYFLKVDEDREFLAQQGYEYARDNLMVTSRVHDLIVLVSEHLYGKA